MGVAGMLIMYVLDSIAVRTWILDVILIRLQIVPSHRDCS